MLNNEIEIQSLPGLRAQQRILALCGPLQLETVPEFLRAVRAVSARILILDFSRVPYVDSSGIGALMQVFVRLGREQRQLGLASLSPRVLAALEITELQLLFSVFHDVDEAEQRLS